MRQTLHAVVLALGVGACVDVPDSVHAHFAPPAATERTNYRPGRHGSAPPVEDAVRSTTAEEHSAPPVPKALENAAIAPDAGAPSDVPLPPGDGGVAP